MMTFELITALIAFAFVSSITPGPNNLMLLASGINFGLKKSLPHMLGVGIGFTLMIVLVGTGLVQIFELFPVSYTILKVVSIAYLSYLAWKIATASSLDKKTSAKTKPISFIQAVLFQWVNPKAWMMAITAVSTYTGSTNNFYSVLIVALIFGSINFPSISIWTVAGVKLQHVLNNPLKLKIFNVTAAILLIVSLYPALKTAAF